MRYIDRTLQIQSALLERNDLLQKIYAIFDDCLRTENILEPLGKGTGRRVFPVGECKINKNQSVHMLLKVTNDPLHMTWANLLKNSSQEECGAFETYYDFTSGHIPIVSFVSKRQHEEYLMSSGNLIKLSFSLSDDWGGTRVNVGDIGALPYFQLVVKYKTYFGLLTEGEPPLITPLATASCDEFENSIENQRIIDLNRPALLVTIDRGDVCNRANNLGLKTRGAKYFKSENRLNL